MGKSLIRSCALDTTPVCVPSAKYVLWCFYLYNMQLTHVKFTIQIVPAMSFAAGNAIEGDMFDVCW